MQRETNERIIVTWGGELSIQVWNSFDSNKLFVFIIITYLSYCSFTKKNSTYILYIQLKYFLSQ